MKSAARNRILGLGVALGVATGCGSDPAVELDPGSTHPDQGPVIVVVADTLRADHLGLYGYTRPTSPHLDAWAEEGRVYERAFATAPWTLPSFGSLYTGRWPMRHRAGVMKEEDWLGRSVPNRLSSDTPTLAEILRDRGFATGAVMNNPYLDPSFGVARGFEVYDHVPGDNQDIRRADAMVARAFELIDQWGDRPFFLVLHLFDPHMDYDPPAPVRGTFSAEYATQFSLPVTELGQFRRREFDLSAADIEFVRAAYDEEILFVDQQLAELRLGLEDRGLHGDALVVLTSDHGEELFDHDGFEHGHAMWQELVNVPFVVWGPDVQPGRELAPVSLVDVMPTILEWVGVESATDLDGLSLWDNLTAQKPVADRTLLMESPLYGRPHTGLVRWPFKMIVDAHDIPVSIVDLDQDPLERANVLDSHPTVADEMTAELHAHRRTAARARVEAPDEAATPSDEILERLKSLGYVR